MKGSPARNLAVATYDTITLLACEARVSEVAGVGPGGGLRKVKVYHRPST